MKAPFSTAIGVCLRLLGLWGIAFSGLSGVAQTDQWVWRNPLPQGNALWSVVWSGSQFVAAGSLGAILTSSDGTSWILRPSGTVAGLRQVAWGAGQFIVVGEGGVILASPDGVHWTARASDRTTYLRGISWFGNQFVAVGDGGVILTSADGQSWISRASGTTANLQSVAWSGTVGVVVGSGGAILTSTDGTNWTSRTSGISSTLRRVVEGGGLFVAVGDSGAPLTSPDGMNWTSRYLGLLPLYDVAWNGRQFVAVGPGLASGFLAVHTSRDGISWADGTLAPESYPYAIAANTDRFVAVGSAGMIMTSPDAITWTNRVTGPTDDFHQVAWNGDLLVAVGGGRDPIRSAIVTSSDGVGWMDRSPATTGPLYGIAWGGGRFAAVGAQGAILTSPDALAWISRTSGITTTLNAVAWGGSQFVAVGTGGSGATADDRILTSPDGQTWTKRIAGTSQSLNAVAWNGRLFVAVGSSGAVVTSPDGAAWAGATSGTTSSLRSVAWSGTQFVAVGQSGAVLTSADGVSWLVRQSGTTNSLNAVAWNGSRFVAVGGDLNYQLSKMVLTSADGITWSSHTSGPSRILFGVIPAGRRFVAVGELGTIVSVDAPAVSTQPQSQIVAIGTNVNFAVAVDGQAPLGYQWRLNGTPLVGATSPTLALPAVQPAGVGIYDVIASNAYGSLTSNLALLGVSSASKVVGNGTEIGSNVPHPNGNILDQVLLTGATEAITTDFALNQVTRTSYIDLNDDIVQVELSGPGTLSLVLGDATAPARPVKYNQAVDYVKGHAGIVITGADERTNVSVYTVGRATAFDPTGAYNILLSASATNDPAKNGSPLFQGHATTVYDGIADIAFIAISSANGKFGGVRTANVHYFASRGITGVYAPGVAFSGLVYVGDVTAFDAAIPVLVTGSVGDMRVTGGNLLQDNGRPVTVAGITQLKFVDGSTSGAILLPARTNQAVLEQAGVDVTEQIVVNPGP